MRTAPHANDAVKCASCPASQPLDGALKNSHPDSGMNILASLLPASMQLDATEDHPRDSVNSHLHMQCVPAQVNDLPGDSCRQFQSSVNPTAGHTDGLPTPMQNLTGARYQAHPKDHHPVSVAPHILMGETSSKSASMDEEDDIVTFIVMENAGKYASLYCCVRVIGSTFISLPKAFVQE